MYASKFLKAFSLIAATAIALPVFGQSVNPCNQTTKLSAVRTITSNGTGTLSGSGSTQIHYEMWTEGGNNNKMIWYGASAGGGSAFRAEWNKPNDFLGRIGYFWDNGGKYTQYQNLYCDFNFTRSGQSTAGDYSYIGIYGWTKNPLVEYYIVEDWYGNQWQDQSTPITTNTTSGSVQGTFTVDGASYQIIKNTRTGPSINGNTTFAQYFSIRQTPRKCGTISLTEHFKKWESLGMTMGNMYEAKFLNEAGGGTGWFEATYIAFSQESSPRGSGNPTTYTMNVTVSPTTGGSVTKNPNAANYNSGATVKLTATPAAGYTFDNWSGDAAGNKDTVTVTMNANKNVTATFKKNTSTFTLTTTVTPALDIPEGAGTVTRSPATPASGKYDSATVVKLTAVPAQGYIFDKWSGNASGTRDTVSVVMNANKTVTAEFKPRTTGISRGALYAKRISGLTATASNSALNVTFNAKNSGAATIKLYSLKGDLISSASINTVAGNNYSHTFNSARLSTGYYLVSLYNDGRMIEQARAVVPR
jgi:endo-1,4-beta-xylanase